MSELFNLLMHQPGAFHGRLHSQPGVIRRGCPELVDCFSEEDVDRLLTIQGLPNPTMYLLNRQQRYKKFALFPYCDPHTRLHCPWRVFREYIENSASILLNNANRYHPTINALHCSIRQRFDALTNTVCILSPPNSQGTSPHTDGHPNISVQISGCKRWMIWNHVAQPILASATSGRDLERLLGELSNASAPLVDEVLVPGDVVVIPQRYLHTALTLGRHSLSVVFQIECCDSRVFAERAAQDSLLHNPVDDSFVEVV